MSIPTEAEYLAREQADLFRQLRMIETAPLIDRQEARKDWLAAMHNQALVAERVRWLLDGSYGKGAYNRAWAIVRNKRCNRTAGIGQLIAALEWQCPHAFAAQAWNKLTATEQQAVDAGVLLAIIEAEKESKETK